MIDIESQVFSMCASALRAEFPNMFVTGESVNAPPSFPCAAIREMSNSTYLRSLDNALKEHHANVMIQCEFFSNLKSGKKAECRKMAAIVDEVMLSNGFTRTFMQPVENPADNTKHRIVSRYTAVVSENKMIYRR